MKLVADTLRAVLINDTVEANEIDPELWYPKGRRQG
jgi:hypothetical protein